MLTLFAVGLIETVNPNLLQMDDAMKAALASPLTLVATGALTVLELVGMCVPVVDEVIDAAMTFVVPIISCVGTASTFGLLDYTLPQSSSSSSSSLDSTSSQEEQEAEANQGNADENGERRLTSVSSAALWILKAFLLVTGIGLALSMHAVKMLIRLIGEGWATSCLAVLEVVGVSMTITLAVFIRPIAIVVGSFIVLIGVYNLARILREKAEENESPDGNKEGIDYHRNPEEALQKPNPQLQQQNFKFTAPAMAEAANNGDDIKAENT